MNRVDYIKKLLKRLEDKTGIQGLTLDENKQLSFEINEEVISIEPINDMQMILIYSPVTVIKKELTIDVHKKIQKMNLFGILTRGATLCMQEETKSIILGYFYPFEYLHYNVFEQMILNLIALAPEIKKELAGFSS